jgi:cobalt-zinc-cadmium efflux system protein
MTHNHDHGAGSYDRAFAVGVGLNLAFVLIEVFYGLRAHSVALVADAGHNFSDVLGLLLAWGAAVLARRLPTARRTYGLRRLSILAAMGNAMLLLFAIGAIAWEAVERLAQPVSVAAGTVIWVAAAGVVVNAATALLFMAGRRGDLNIRGAYLHMAADAGVSLGVVIAGSAIVATGWLWLDPAISLTIVAVILVGTWGLLRDSLNLVLDAVPENIDPTAVHAYLAGVAGVTEVHDLHIWGMSTTETALTAHLVHPGALVDDDLLARVGRELHDRFGIEHATLQVERGTSVPCRLAPAHVL